MSSSVVCPTILAESPSDYEAQLERIKPFAKRIQIDISDGKFARNRTINVAQTFWPEGLLVDLHMMVDDPGQYMYDYIKLAPHLVIFHAEAEDSAEFGLDRVITQLELLGIKAGLALLPETTVKSQRYILEKVNHLLIFSGRLGHFGGTVDFGLLSKVEQAKSINPGLEIGWDGGVTDKTATQLIKGGVDVLNVGGFIQKSDNPGNAYAILEQITKNKNVNK